MVSLSYHYWYNLEAPGAWRICSYNMSPVDMMMIDDYDI